GEIAGSASNCARTSGGTPAGARLRRSGGFGGFQPLPSTSIQIGLVIACGVWIWMRFGLRFEVGGRGERWRPNPSAVRDTGASTGGYSLGVRAGNMLLEPVTSATTQLSLARSRWMRVW